MQRRMSLTHRPGGCKPSLLSSPLLKSRIPPSVGSREAPQAAQEGSSILERFPLGSRKAYD